MKLRVILFTFVLAVSTLGCGGESAESSDVASISQQALLERSAADLLILDVRSSAEYEASHVPGALNIPHDELAERLGELDEVRNETVVVYCQSGVRAGIATSLLAEAGFEDVLHLDGDMSGWLEAGRPVE